MPLIPGKANIGRNISELENHGSRPRSHKQIVAIALHTAYDKKKPGKRLKKFGKGKNMANAQAGQYSGQSDIEGQ